MDLLAHLETFVAVADELSFSKAADELGIAQPLLSRRVKTLEAHLGGALFDRSRRQIELTEFGELMVPYARDVLHRGEHLLRVARDARRSTAVTLGVPPDCDPQALARVLTAGVEHGVTLRVQELPAAERAAAPADWSSLALIRVPAMAPLRVRLGLASLPPRPSHDRPIHLEELRPRRGAADRRPPTILVTPEDDVPLFTDPLRKAIARAGLPESTIRTTTASAAALAETIAGTGMLLCSARFARRHDVAWAPLADGSLHRGYRLAGASDAYAGWLLPLLADAIGVDAGSPRGHSAPVRADDRVRLAARG